MDINDKLSFEEIMLGLGEVYTKEITKPLLRIYFNALKDMSICTFEEATTKHVTSTEKSGSFFPKPADLISQVKGAAQNNAQLVDDKANVSWHVIEAEIRRIGSYGTLQLEDKQALAAVKALGGWKYLCSLTVDKMVWAHKEFVSAYQNYERTPIELLPQKLAGRIELEQHKAEAKSSMASLSDGVKRYQQNMIEDNKDSK